MESENFGHQHPLLLLTELDQQSRNQSKEAYCSRCGEGVTSLSTPSLSCVEEKCGFYLHKKCGEAALQMNHPFHPNHPLLLLPTPPHAAQVCDFCTKKCEMFVYRCDFCDLDFHIKCALFTYDIAKKNLEELQHLTLLEPPFISSESFRDNGQQHQYCFGCWEPLANSTYFSLDSGFNLHTKCSHLPLKINHMSHRKHPLVLQFNSERLSCKICKETQRRGFVYGCPSCKFVVHIRCVSPLPVIEDKRHPHPFTMFQRQVPFTCDACGTEGNYVACVCNACHVMVHKECISLPPIIKCNWHDHHVFHKYFLQEEDFKSSDCVICHDEVNIEHGSYSCLDCKIIFHVNCVKRYWYDIVSLENEGEKSSDIVESFTFVMRNDAGETIEIKHINHRHNLMLSDKIMEHDKHCDGCLLPILVPFYYCPLCDFSLHKACAEMPKMKHLWFHHCQEPFILRKYSDCSFYCNLCCHWSNGFAYECTQCDDQQCLRCVIARTPGALTCPVHEHPLLFYHGYEGQCNGCDDDFLAQFLCKVCNFSLCFRCFSLPIRAQHKCDEHLLTLTYHDDNDYLEYRYCDICEEKRDPNHLFYHCAACDNSAHPRCVIEKYPFIKLGSIYSKMDHPHPLTFVRKIYYYPKCIECDKSCQDLALECTKSDCNYIGHWECLAQFHLQQSSSSLTSLWKSLGI